MSRNQVFGRLLAALAVMGFVTLIAVTMVRRSDSPIRTPRTPVRMVDRSTPGGTAQSAAPTPRLDAPDERHGIDDGVADAARQFAIQFVTPELKFPETAQFPEDSIYLEPVTMMNLSTGDRIEHWQVDGEVESKNDHGLFVRSRWRIMIGRVDDKFFPVVVSLEGFPVYQMRGHVAMLQDARRADVQRKTAQVDAKNAKELAENRALWQSNAAAKPAERKAREALKLAVDLLDAGRHEPAHRRLQEIIERYPDTSAAAEAEKLLEQ
ncbi:MAG TPA: hypothetical protein VGM05_02095 [Planctomycetaceae bacterium]